MPKTTYKPLHYALASLRAILERNEVATRQLLAAAYLDLEPKVAVNVVKKVYALLGEADQGWLRRHVGSGMSHETYDEAARRVALAGSVV